MNDPLERAKVLLKAAHEMLQLCDDALVETVYYDDAHCDGFCLSDDIAGWFDEVYGEVIG